MNREGLRQARLHKNVAAFLEVIAAGESGNGDVAYRIENGGRILPEFPVEHPSKGMRAPPGRAFGKYQFIPSTWAGLVKKYGFPDMSPESQDDGAVALIAERGALDEVMAGRFDEACYLLHPVWVSLPGGTEQNAATKTAKATFLRYGGQLYEPKFEAPEQQPNPDFNPDTLDTEHYEGREPYEYTPYKEAPVALPLIPITIAAAQAFLPRLIEMIPALGAAFGSGSEVQKRNVAAASMVADAITKTLGEPNLQAAMERMESDPAALTQARAAVTSILPTLVEAGGGGLEGARKAAENQSGDWRKLVFSLPFVGLVAFLPTIWAVVAAAVFRATWLIEMDPQMRGTVIGFVMGTVAGGIVMYIYGASMTKAPAK